MGARAIVEGMVLAGGALRLLRLDLQVFDDEGQWEKYLEVRDSLVEEGYTHNPYDPKFIVLREHQFGRFLVEVIT